MFLNSTAYSTICLIGCGALASKKNSQMNKIKKEMFYLTTHSTHFIYGYMASDIW